MARKDTENPDTAAERYRELIGRTFPQAVKNGKIDFDSLLTLLGAPPEERFRFCWPGKSRAEQLAQTPPDGALLPLLQESEAWETTRNLYIEGDNLEALKLLQPEFAGKIRVIYIDPPYNTGNDFIYRDDYRESCASCPGRGAGCEDAGRYHAGWLNLMYPRLLLAKKLLAPDGVIFISIDDCELANLKKICCEVFGEKNYINLITVKTKTSSGASGGGEDRRLKKNTEYLLIYVGSRGKIRLNPPQTKIPISEYIFSHRQSGTGFFYTRILEDCGEKALLCEQDGLKIYTHRNFRFSTVCEKMKAEGLTLDETYSRYFDSIFMVTNAQTSLLEKVNRAVPGEKILVSYEYVPRSGRNKGKPAVKYVWNRTMVVWLADSAVKENGAVYKTCCLGTMWDDISWGRLDLEGGVPFKNGKKPLRLLERLLQMADGKDSTVLDFFSGSATTAHAVMAQNARDGGTRRFIMVQIPESCEKDPAAAAAGYRNICEIGEARIRLAAKKIRAQMPGGQPLPDLGFRVYRIVQKDGSDGTCSLAEK
jgi:adenine-specific DNA-methyltransferase